MQIDDLSLIPKAIGPLISFGMCVFDDLAIFEETIRLCILLRIHMRLGMSVLEQASSIQIKWEIFHFSDNKNYLNFSLPLSCHYSQCMELPLVAPIKTN